MSPSLSTQNSPTRHQTSWCLVGEFWFESEGDMHSKTILAKQLR